jgi:hypothetical protein
MNRIFSCLAGALLAGCSTAVPAPLPLAPAGPPGACPLAGSGDWAAWVNTMPGPGSRPTLIVTGKATVPTGGWTFAWRNARVMESYPVQVAVDLQPMPPGGGATQAIVTHDLRFEIPIAPPVGSVTIRCGGQVLARIDPVETAH